MAGNKGEKYLTKLLDKMYIKYYIVNMRMIILIFTVCSLLFALPVNAQNGNGNGQHYSNGTGGMPADRHFPKTGFFHLYLGANLAISDYSEPDIGVTHSNYYFPGFVIRAALENPDRMPVFASLRYKYQSGTYNYNGYIQNLGGQRTRYSETALPVSKYDIEFLAGAVNNRFRGFIGLQYERYDDKAHTVNGYFYKRTRESLYGVLGFGAKHTWEEYRSAELVVKAKPLISGEHSSRLSDLGSVWTSVGTIKKDQSRGFRFEVSVEYNYEMLWIEPYISYTRIAATEIVAFSMTPSPLVGRINEPLNVTTEFGINIGIRF